MIYGAVVVVAYFAVSPEITEENILNSVNRLPASIDLLDSPSMLDS